MKTNRFATPSGLAKVACVRNPNVLVGQTAKGHLNCPCGNAPETDLDPSQGNVQCACGRLYSYSGWLLS